jgi:hypothetical protein
MERSEIIVCQPLLSRIGTCAETLLSPLDRVAARTVTIHSSAVSWLRWLCNCHLRPFLHPPVVSSKSLTRHQFLEQMHRLLSGRQKFPL